MTADIYLKFPDGEAMRAALTLPNPEPDGEPLPRFPECAIDFVGAIYRETGRSVEGEDGDSWPEMERVEGIHVNLRGELTEDEMQLLTPYVVVPKNPVRVWL